MFTEVLAPCETLFTKNSYHPPPLTVNSTLSPVQAVLFGASDDRTAEGTESTLNIKGLLELPQPLVKYAVTFTSSLLDNPLVVNTLLACLGPIEIEFLKNSYSSPTLEVVI